MLELSLLGIIGLAAVYGTALWWMGRHDDVLYGDFVSPEGAATLTSAEPALLRQQPTSPVTNHPPEAAGRPPAAMRAAIPPVRSGGRPPSRTSAVPQRPAPPAPIVESQPVGNQLTTAQPLRPSSLPPVTPSAQHQSPSRPIPAPARGQTPARDDVLNSLLETIKHDLSNAVGKS
ncbi:hypothetical protein D4Q71_02155 [Rhodopseudomonas palustris]|uniref:Uncharacterized protein n=1 Tax=Rhodopseudomonas palustris (strain ATCC BAA-98 / CGA009) TaxID=258594 RepID=Q6N0K1_RHOPA|nr:hypothetical protein B1S06_05560 [Rhodopseudomonas palustris]RJF68822.1 hypothetical protein D4Q71_02155 [Rhodopseudomonas palustris]CAE30201.1 conserved hypothetical protein [Rhodopseudomonas palustris CGA009]